MAGQLVGRLPEVLQIGRALTEVTERGRAILVSGEPGIGKTALVTEAVRRAAERGMRVLSTTGVQCEIHLPFAGLHQLLRPVLAEPPNQDDNPTTAAQRNAISAALGMSEVQAPVLFMTAMAGLEIVADLAAHQPALIVAEDVHWLDRPTWEVLTFIGRRLDSEPIVLLATSRDDQATEDTVAAANVFTRIHLEGLDNTTAADLLDGRAPEPDPGTPDTPTPGGGGNPLALVELPKALTQLGDRAQLPTWLPLTTRLEEAFAERGSDLPPNARSLLLIAAVDDSDSLGEILAAGAELTGAELDLVDIEPAATAGLLDIDEAGVRFRHPLVRSAIYQGASLAQRHAAF